MVDLDIYIRDLCEGKHINEEVPHLPRHDIAASNNEILIENAEQYGVAALGRVVDMAFLAWRRWYLFHISSHCM